MDRGELRRVDAGALKGAHLRYFDYVMAAFVTILLLSNVIGAGKVASIDLPGIGPWPFGAGILFFPVSYVLGDVLTEVYGYANARRCVWVITSSPTTPKKPRRTCAKKPRRNRSTIRCSSAIRTRSSS